MTIQQFPGPAALVQSQTISVSPMMLLTLIGHKSTAPTAFVQLYDQAGGAPAGTPVLVRPLMGGANEHFEFEFYWNFFNGCVIAYSTTRTTFTGAGLELWFAARWVDT